jgi:hypothetical protein
MLEQKQCCTVKFLEDSKTDMNKSESEMCLAPVELTNVPALK